MLWAPGATHFSRQIHVLHLLRREERTIARSSNVWRLRWRGKYGVSEGDFKALARAFCVPFRAALPEPASSLSLSNGRLINIIAFLMVV